MNSFDVTTRILMLALAASSVVSAALGLYTNLKLNAAIAELRQYIGEVKTGIIEHINNSYVRKVECSLRADSIIAMLERRLAEAKAEMLQQLQRQVRE